MIEYTVKVWANGNKSWYLNVSYTEKMACLEGLWLSIGT